MLTINRGLMGVVVAVGMAGSAPALGPMADDLKLIASDPVTGDEFGSDVSILGDRAVIGTPLDNSFGANSGSVYVFVKDATGQWLEEAKMAPSNSMSLAYFGKAVAMGDGFLVVGAPLHQTNGMFRSGSAYVFEFDGVAWSQTAELIPGDLAEKDRLGSAVAVSGDVAVIGASGAVSGLMGAAARVMDTPGRVGPILGPRVISLGLGWLIVNLVMAVTGTLLSMGAGEIAWEAHLVGFVAGAILIGPFAAWAGNIPRGVNPH